METDFFAPFERGPRLSSQADDVQDDGMASSTAGGKTPASENPDLEGDAGGTSQQDTQSCNRPIPRII